MQIVFYPDLVLAAGPREGLLPWLQPDGARDGREAEPRDLAGRLAVRAQRPRGIAEGARHRQRRPEGLGAEDAGLTVVANSVNIQLKNEWVARFRGSAKLAKERII